MSANPVVVEPTPSLAQNLRDLPRSMSLSAILTGLIVIIIGLSSSIVIIFQAATNAQLTSAQTASWVMAVCIGAGVASIVMSLWFRQPVLAAWSTPGAALLVTSLSHYPFRDAIGAYLIAAIAITILGFSGLFAKVMALVPRSIVMGMLAGVLIRFGFGLFSKLPDAPLLVVVMLIAFFALKRINFRAPTIGALAAGVIVALVSGTLTLKGVDFSVATPLWVAPTFSLEALLGLSLPLFALALTSQNAPGLAVLNNAGYDTPINQALVITGVISVVSAPFGSHGLTLAAITQAIAAGPEAHPDAQKRYSAGVAAGLLYMVVGLFGTTLVSLFAGLPPALVAAIAGLALTGAITSSVVGAMAEPTQRDAGLVALMCTAANFTLFGIGAPFWGLVFGMLTHVILSAGIKPTAAT